MPHNPPIVIPGVFSVRTVWQFDGIDYAVNLHHFETGGPPPTSQAAVNAISSIYKTAFTASGLAPFVTNNVNLNRVGVRWLGAPNFPLIDSNDPGVNGGAVEDPLPLATSLVVTLRTVFVGRRFRGRHYQPGYAENANGGLGIALPAPQTATEDYVGAIRANMTTAGYVMGIVSARAHDAMGLPIPPSIEPVTAHTVRDAIWDVQRRRNRPGI